MASNAFLPPIFAYPISRHRTQPHGACRSGLRRIGNGPKNGAVRERHPPPPAPDQRRLRDCFGTGQRQFFQAFSRFFLDFWQTGNRA